MAAGAALPSSTHATSLVGWLVCSRPLRVAADEGVWRRGCDFSFLVLCSLTLRPTDAEAPSGHTQAGLRPGNVQELHGTAYPTPVLATNDGFSRAG